MLPRPTASAAVVMVVAVAVFGLASPAPAAADHFSSCPSGYVALTFDDGPYPGRTDAVLDALAAWDAKATFFVNGHKIDRYPGTLQRIAAEGHLVANHTWGHATLTLQSDYHVQLQILSNVDSAAAAAVDMAPLLRPPSGAIDSRVQAIVEGMGMAVVMWSVDPQDWRGHSSAFLASHTLSRLQPGANVVFHDGSPASNVAAALPIILSGMADRGFCPGLLDDAGNVVPAFDPGSLPYDPGPTCVGPHPCDRIGFVDGSAGWHVRRAMATDAAVTTVLFGDPGDTPLVGDWNCDGIDTPGVYRPADGRVFLRDGSTSGMADTVFAIGDRGDVPLAGDWDGDGCDTVSVFRPSTQQFFIFDRLADGGAGIGRADVVFTFGNPGDRPFAGDLDGDGADEVALHRPMTGRVYYRQTLTTGAADRDYVFGNPGDIVTAGDWDGDGRDTLAAYRPAIGVWYLNTTSGPGSADHVLWFRNTRGPTFPVVGAFGSG